MKKKSSETTGRFDKRFPRGPHVAVTPAQLRGASRRLERRMADLLAYAQAVEDRGWKTIEIPAGNLLADGLEKLDQLLRIIMERLLADQRRGEANGRKDVDES